jgi:aquaporin Z
MDTNELGFQALIRDIRGSLFFSWAFETEPSRRARAAGQAPMEHAVKEPAPALTQPGDHQRWLAECLGTFALVFAGTGAIVIDQVSGGAVTHVGVALTFGMVVTAMIFALGDTSGAHLNPAMTLGFFLAGRFPGRSVLPYLVAQCAGAFAASGLLRYLFGTIGHLGATLPAGPASQSFVLEVVLTAILMFVVLRVACGPKEQGLIAGLAIGATVGLEAMFAGPICGASMNPARSLAPAVMSGELSCLWVYIAGPALGAALAVPCWAMTRRHHSFAPV